MKSAWLFAGLMLLGCSDDPTSDVTAPPPRSFAADVSFHKSGTGDADPRELVLGHAVFHPTDQGVFTAAYTVAAKRQRDGKASGLFILWLQQGEQRVHGEVACFTIVDNRARIAVKVKWSDNFLRRPRGKELSIRVGDYLAFTVVDNKAGTGPAISSAGHGSHEDPRQSTRDQTSFFTRGDQTFAEGHCAHGQDGTLYPVKLGNIVVRSEAAPPPPPPPVPDVITGLDFAGNVLYPLASPSVLFVFNATISGTAPFPAYPATYIFRAYPRANINYWSGLFHADYASTFSGAQQYYGMHPYPEPPPDGAPRWEISMGGGDVTGATVVMNQWYTQVVRVTSSFQQTYYWNWPNTTTDLVRAQDASKPPAPNPAIIIGDAPWNAGFENYSGVLRGFQFYDAALTDEEIQREIDSPGSVRQPWYLNLNPTPLDISDKSGNGHHPAWVGANRPLLWTSLP